MILGSYWKAVPTLSRVSCARSSPLFFRKSRCWASSGEAASDSSAAFQGPSRGAGSPQPLSEHIPIFRAESTVSPFLAILEAACLAGALCTQLLILRSAQANHQVLGKASSSLVLLTLAVVLSFLHRLWSSGRRNANGLGANVSASGAARLHRLEILHTRQATALVSLERELSKSRLRLHSISKDIQPSLRQVQAESTVHADGLVAVSKKLEALGQDVEDTRELLAELQGASLKQLQLVIQAINLAKASSSKAVGASQQQRGPIS